jgi:peptide/nickel transport system substrate-binding protein
MSSTNHVRWLGLAATAAASLTLAACGSSGSGDTGGGSPAAGGGDTGAAATPAAADAKPAAGGQTVTIAASTEPGTLDPQKEADPGGALVLNDVYDALTVVVNGEVQPQLAAALPKRVSPTHWDVTIKKGVKFNDGSTLTAADVTWSLQRISAKAYATAVPEAANLAGAKQLSANRVQIDIKAADPLLPNKLASVKILKKGTTDFDKTVGTGPYTLQSYDKGQQATIVSNPEFQGTKPQVTKIVFKFIPDVGTRIKALQAGEVDMVPSVSPDQIPDAPKIITSAKENTVYYGRLNNIKGPFSDLRVRQAANYAINKAEITSSLFPKGIASPSPCTIVESGAGDSTNLAPYAYNVDKAKALLKAAGKTNVPITMVWSNGAYPLDREVAQAVEQELEQVGFKPKLKLVDYQDYLKVIYQKGAAAPDLTGGGGSDTYGSATRVYAAHWGKDGANVAINDPKLFSLLDTAASTDVGPSRVSAFTALQTYACSQAVNLFMYGFKEIYAVSKKIDYTPTAPITRPNFQDIKVLAG